MADIIGFIFFFLFSIVLFRCVESEVAFDGR